MPGAMPSLCLAYVAALAWAVWGGRLPFWVLPVSLFLNAGTFFVYWLDKYAAQQRQWRIREQTLHFWALAGGWPGAWMAQQLLRHKSVKAGFLSTYRFFVVLHCTALAAWFLREPLLALLVRR